MTNTKFSLNVLAELCLIVMVTLIASGFISVHNAFAYDLSDQIYHIDIPDDQLNAIQELFPEYGGINPAFVNSNTDPNIHLLDTAEITVTFIDEGAGYKNSFGYTTFDDDRNILTQDLIFENASGTGPGLKGGGSLNTGDTVSIGSFDAGTNIGFWVQANGYNDPDGHVYHTLDEHNPDGMRHVAIVADEANQNLVIGIED